MQTVTRLKRHQIEAVLAKLQAEYGGPDKWPLEVLANAKVLFQRIDVEQLMKLPRDSALKLFQVAQNLDVTNAQVQVTFRCLEL